MRQPDCTVGTQPDQLPQAAFEPEQGAGIGFERCRIGRMDPINAPEKFLIARQMKTEVLLQPQNVADQRGAPFFLVRSIGHPEQKRNPADKQDESQPRQYP